MTPEQRFAITLLALLVRQESNVAAVARMLGMPAGNLWPWLYLYYAPRAPAQRVIGDLALRELAMPEINWAHDVASSREWRTHYALFCGSKFGPKCGARVGRARARSRKRESARADLFALAGGEIRLRA